jgi:UDP-sulfoquinovose synthase
MFSVEELAERVARVTRERGLSCEIAHVANPRVERESHYYNCVNTNLRSLGLEPTLLSDETIAGLIGLAGDYKERVDLRLIPPRVEWRPAEPSTGADAVA